MSIYERSTTAEIPFLDFNGFQVDEESPDSEIIDQEPVVILNNSISIETIDRIFYEPPVATSTCKKTTHVVAKLFLCLMCYTSTLASLEPARRSFTNVILQNIFAYGDALAWGTLSSYCTLNIYNDMVENPYYGSKERMHICALILYWSSVITLGLLSELPTAYTSYYYNKDQPFLYIYTPIVSSCFAIFSNHELFQKILNPNNFIKQKFLPPEQQRISQAQNRFRKLIKYCIKSLSTNENNSLTNNIIITQNNTDKTTRVKEVLLEVVREGLKKSKDQIRTPTINLSKKIVKVASYILPCGSFILDGILTYEGYRLILNENWPIPFIIILAVGPDVYLQVDLTQKFYSNILNKLFGCRNIRTHQSNCCSTINTIIKCSLIGLFTILGLADDTTIVRDNVGFNSFLGVLLAISVLSTSAILLISSMNYLYNDITDFYQRRKKSVEQLEQDNLIKRLGHLEEFFKNLPRQEFENILIEMDESGLNTTTLSEQNYDELDFNLNSTQINLQE